MPDALLRSLSPAEHARAERFARARDGLLWGRAHGVLRTLLGRYLESDPRTLRFDTGTHGKPTLRGRGEELRFNLSHSGTIALYALSAGAAVGVDVEIVGRRTDVAALAMRAFGPAEARRLAALGPVDRQRELARMWVRYEAELKCRGTGIGGGETQARRPWITDLDAGPEAAAAVAVAEPPEEVCCWEWQA